MKKRHFYKHPFLRLNAGFTILEIVIVLVVIGLIIGGVLVGMDMLNSFRLKKLYLETQEINMGVTLFKDRYRALPGDFRKAKDYFGAGDTANGNADNHISGMGWYGGGYTYEAMCFWNHLAHAGLYSYFPAEGVCPYNAAYPGHGTIGAEGMAAPSKAFSEVAFRISDQFTGRPNRSAIQTVNEGCFNGCKFFSPQEAYILDKKYDDGKPSTGRIWLELYNPACNFGGNYQSSNTDRVCRGLSFSLLDWGK